MAIDFALIGNNHARSDRRPQMQKSSAPSMTELQRAIVLGVAGAAGTFSLGCLGVAVTGSDSVLVSTSYTESVMWNYLIPGAVTAGLAVFLFFVAFRPTPPE